MNQLTDMSFLDATAHAIVGQRGSGKTNTMYSLLEKVEDRPVYLFDHPRPELPESRGWKVMRRLEQMYSIHHCVVAIDEPQLVIPKLDKRANEGLQKLLSIARHRDITLIFATCDSRWVTRALESYIDCWLVHDVEPKLLKQGSLAKKIIQRHVICDADEFRLEKGEFVFYGRDYEEIDGFYRVPLLPWFNEDWSKPYRIVDEVDEPVKAATNGHKNGKVKVSR